jgi:hypothetical protein
MNQEQAESQDEYLHFVSDGFAQMTSRRQWCVRIYEGEYKYFDKYKDALAYWNLIHGHASEPDDKSEFAGLGGSI